MPRRRSEPQILAQAGDLVVVRDPDRPSGRLLRAGGMDASYVDLADPRHLEFDYLRWIADVLRLARARHVLHIGGGGCALARALLAGDRASRHDVCERSEAVLALARAHLGLRRTLGLRVRRVDGGTFLARCSDGAYDAIVVDAFIGARVPPSLVSLQAAAELARVAPLTLVNVLDDRSGGEVASVGAALREHFPQVLAIEGRGGNTVLAAVADRLDLTLLGARLAADRSPARVRATRESAPLRTAAAPRRD